MRVFEEPTKLLTTRDRRVRVRLLLRCWEQDDVAFALMRTFGMMLRDILRQNMTKRSLTGFV
jgi:hypothetical protein